MCAHLREHLGFFTFATLRMSLICLVLTVWMVLNTRTAAAKAAAKGGEAHNGQLATHTHITAEQHIITAPMIPKTHIEVRGSPGEQE